MSIERFGVEAPLVVGDGQRPGLVARFDGAGDLQWAQTLGPTVVQVGPVATNTDGQTAFAVSAAAELWDGSTVGSASMVRVAAGGTIDWAAPLADGAAVTGMAIVTGGGAVWAMENGALGRFGPDGGLEWRHAVDTPEGRAWLGMSVALLDRAYVLAWHQREARFGATGLSPGLSVVSVGAGGAVRWAVPLTETQRGGGVHAQGRRLTVMASSFAALEWAPQRVDPVAPDGVSAIFETATD